MIMVNEDNQKSMIEPWHHKMGDQEQNRILLMTVFLAQAGTRPHHTYHNLGVSTVTGHMSSLVIIERI